jgi:hypothetical protein
MPQVVRDGHRPLPGVAGKLGLACRELGGTEMGQSLGLAVPIAEFAEQADRLAQAACGFGVVAELAMGVAELSQVQVAAGPLASPSSSCQAIGLVAPGQRLPVVSQLGVAPADVVGRSGLPARSPMAWSRWASDSAGRPCRSMANARLV